MPIPVIEIEIPINPNSMFMKSSKSHAQQIPSSSRIEEMNDSELDDLKTDDDISKEKCDVETNIDSLLDDELKNELLELEIN